MKQKLSLFLFLMVVLCATVNAQTPSARYIFDDFILPRTYQQPVSTIAKSLNISTPTAHVDITMNHVIAQVRSTQFGVNTPFRNGSDQRTRSALYNGKVTALRFPAGSGSNTYFHDGVVPASMGQYMDASGNTLNVTGTVGTKSTYLTPSNFISFKNDVNGQAIVVVNYFYARYGITSSGTRADRVQQAADYAAAFVRKLNVELGGNVKYWEIGNECYGSWEVGYKMADPAIGTVTGTEYGEDFNVFVQAMKAVDPTIKCGAILYDGGSNWNSQVLPQVKNTADFVSVHEYFTTVGQAADFNNILAAVPQINTLRNSIQSDIVQYTGNPADYYPIALTEFNSRGAYNCSMINGVFVSQILGEVIKNNYGLVSLWVSEWGWDGSTKDCKGFLAKADPDQADYTARQAYIPYYYYAKCFGNSMVESASDNSNVVVYASTFSSGEIGLVLINTSAGQQEVALNVNNGSTSYVPSTLQWYEFYANTIDLNNSQYKKFYVNDSTSATNGGGPVNLDNVKPYQSTYDNTKTVSLRPYSVIYMVVKTSDMVVDPTLLYSDKMESTDGYASNFLVSKQTAWNTYNATNNLYPNTNAALIWKDIYSSTVTSDKNYTVRAYADERPLGTGSQCLKFTINNLAFGAAHDKTVRLRGADGKISFAQGETLDSKYEVTLWARVDGTSRPVFKTNSGGNITVTNQWAKYTIDRYTTGTSGTALSLDFAPQTDNADLTVYIDDVKVRLKSSGSPSPVRALQQTDTAQPEEGIQLIRMGNDIRIVTAQKIESVNVYMLNGGQVMSASLPVGNVVHTSGLARGVYLLTVQSGGKVYKCKLVN